MTISSGGILYVSGGNSPVIGDSETLGFAQAGSGQTFIGESGGSGYVAYGDAFELTANARGGDDYMSGGSYVGNSVATVSIAAAGPFFLSSGGVQFAGDAENMYGVSQGGNDTIIGGLNSDNVFVGDALQTASGMSRGGNDYISGGSSMDASTGNIILGDAYAFGNSFGPSLASASSGVHASVSGPSSRVAVIGGSDELHGGDAIGYLSTTDESNLVVGDAYAITGNSRGGADLIYGGDATVYSSGGADAQVINFMTGDGYVMLDRAAGAGDEMHGGSATQATGGDAYAINLMAGDSFVLVGGGVRAGSDSLYGGDSHALSGYSDGYGALTLNFMAGDGFLAEGKPVLGNDHLHGGSGDLNTDGYALNVMFGDIGDTSFFSLPLGPSSSSVSMPSSLQAFETQLTSEMHALAATPAPSTAAPKYGNDVITGGDGQAENFMVGDAEELISGAKAGNDTIVGGGFGSMNLLVGDAIYMDTGSRGGNDRLVSGEGNDDMYGDAYQTQNGRGGADRFVFAPSNGTDRIEDFHRSEGDVIDLHAFAANADFKSFGALMNSGRIEDTPDGALIHLGIVAPALSVETDTVLLVGVPASSLSSSMFAL